MIRPQNSFRPSAAKPMSSRAFFQSYYRLMLAMVAVFGVGSTAFVDPPAKLIGQENIEIDEAEEQDEEHGDGDVKELLRLRSTIRAQVDHLNAQLTIGTEGLSAIDELVNTIRQRQESEKKLEQAHENDSPAVDRLEVKLDQLEREAELRRQQLELKLHLMEVHGQLQDATHEEFTDRERVELLTRLAAGLRHNAKLIDEQLPQLLTGNPADVEKLQERLEQSIEERVERPEHALEVLDELREAEDEEEFDEADRLQAELSRLLRATLPEVHSADSPNESPGQSSPVVQPIVVTQDTVADYAHLDLHRDIEPLLRRYCFDCHSDAESSGELNFERLLATTPIVKNRRQWINVIEQAKNHVMPPEDAEQPTLDERKQMVLSLHHAIVNFDYSDIRDPGFESARRMTHREYSNTIRDLFGIDIDVVDRFPDDLTATSGFDNSANSLFLQPLLMERYVGLAEHIVTTAFADPPNSPAWKRIFVSRPSKDKSDSEAARDLMRRFLLRAFRRPPLDSEVNRFVRQIERAAQGGESYEDAVKATVQTVLISPHFLLLTEADQSNNAEVFAVGNYELASRLSYFLWASMPDDELFRLANQGELTRPDVLSAQVERMLNDPRTETLGSVFAAQWLGSQHLGVRMRLDPIDNPWCTETLMSAMRQETSMFFNHLVTEDRPITELVDADYTFLNEELAKLYRIDGVMGPKMRRVEVNAERRGGIFGQGSLLAVTSFPGRTSPVVRGKWILDSVLGTPPPPPPPNVDELSEEIEESRRLSFREKLELHRQKPNCYACHSEMDPLGFSLENYDWFGRYRARRGRTRVDATGQLPNGTTFEGLGGLKQVVVEERQQDLIRQVTQKLLAYALGRQLEYYDEPAIRQILENVQRQENRMGVLVREIALSFPFRYKKSASAL